MDPQAVLAAAAADWERLAALIGAEGLRRLAGPLGAMRDTGTRDPADGRPAEAAARLLLDLLPADEAGRLDRAAGARYATAAADGTAADFRADDLAVLVLDGHRMVGPVLGEVRRRLLAATAVDRAELDRLGGDPRAPGLLRLAGPGGHERLPRFQFDAAGRLRPTVLAVNTLLGADRDPWGVADWWLSPNAWLGAAPAELLGTGREHELTDAAGYLAEGE
ncbi:hypothetical protein [Kitasatospora sp. NPDC088351]|uniref:hypothetical protein n=1 Tax=unclassified Kitasatospora TaxID=2633591 RepID=UPI00342FE391